MCGIWGYISTSIQNDRYFDNIGHRGPDCKNLIKFARNEYNIALGFHRLAIIDLENGKQPFYYNYNNGDIVYLLCNGEIYNYKYLIEKYNLDTTSDCEVILKMYLQNMNIKDIIEELDGEFSFVLIKFSDKNIDIHYGRDRFGIRPLFYRFDDTGFYFSSELKGLENGKGKQVEPRKIYYNNLKEENVYTYYYIGNKKINNDDIYENIRNSLIKSVSDRMQSERPLGALLSGGLDSSLICGIASRILKEKGKRLFTFSIGMDRDSPDIINARKVAEYINSIHHEIIIPVEEWLNNIDNVIKQTETYDITTIRASTGQYLISRWISENTDIKVILNGDGSDELTSGYLYFYNVPNEIESHNENLLLLNQIHYYDVLRVDRGISAFGLESRVPFLSHNFVDMYLNCDKNLRIPIKGKRIEKWLLRESFASENIIPNEVLWRQKEAFSDGCSSFKKSWYEYIQEYVENKVADGEYKEYPSKEAYYYHKKFKEYYPESDLKVIYWQPKFTTEHGGDPSARKLKSLY
jgi:asparagine synthase (glutamine-hydrolysing)